MDAIWLSLHVTHTGREHITPRWLFTLSATDDSTTHALLADSLVLLSDAIWSFSSPRSLSTTCFFMFMSTTPYCSRRVERI